MPYRNKTYIAFDADTDINLYNLMKAWKANDNIEFDFHNAHELNNLRPTSSEETIKGKLKERLKNTKIFVLLIGEHTKDLYKFVRWEIDVALQMQLPIIAVNLNKSKKYDSQRCPPILKEELAIHIAYGQKIITFAMDNWPMASEKHKENGHSGPYEYNDSIYDKVGQD